MSNSIVLEKDMAYSRKDMLAGLRRAFGDAVIAHDDSVTVDLTEGCLTVELGPELERKIALMRVVHMPVTLTFEGFSDVAYVETLGRFDRAFQRGGG